MSTDLEIVATGARTPVGLRAETSAAAVRAGISRLREFPFVMPQGEPVVVGADPRLDDGLEGRARMVVMLEGVLDEVRAKLGVLDLSRGGCDAWIALPEARPGFSDEDAQWVTRQIVGLLSTRQILARAVVGGRGHAGALACIERIAAPATREQRSLHLVIGVDSYLATRTFSWLEARRQLPQPGIANGFDPGEAAGCLVLASRSMRQHLRLPCLASIVGVGTAQEHRLRDSETGSLGEGMTAAVLRAIAGSSSPAADAVYCDINGERYRSEEWGLFAMRAHQAMRSLSYEAPSQSWGDVGAAFGVLGGILAEQSFARRYAPGPRALVMAGSEGGLRGAMLLQEPQGTTSSSPGRGGGARS